MCSTSFKNAIFLRQKRDEDATSMRILMKCWK